MNAVLQVEHHTAIETWTLNRPDRRNALDPDLVNELHLALIQAEARRSRVVIIRGAGAGFSAGADLTYLLECAQNGQSPLPHLRRICDLTRAIESSPMVFVAAIHGFAVAGGLEIALSCDLVVAGAGSRIGDGHVKNNLVPGGGASVRMPRKLGAGLTSWLALSGELVSAEKLQVAGWLHSVVEPARVMSTAEHLAATLAARPAEAQRRYKAEILPDPQAMHAALEAELDVFERHWASDNVAAHLARFLNHEEGHRTSRRAVDNHARDLYEDKEQAHA